MNNFERNKYLVQEEFLKNIANSPYSIFSEFYDVKETVLHSNQLRFNDTTLCCFAATRAMSAIEAPKTTEGQCVPNVNVINLPNSDDNLILTDSKYYVLHRIPLDALWLIYGNELFMEESVFTPYKEKLYSCGFPNLDNTYFVVSDPFTHRFLISQILQYFFRILVKWNHNPFISYLDFTVCAPPARVLNSIYFEKGMVTGLQLSEYIDGGRLTSFDTDPILAIHRDKKKIKPMIVEGILKQILSTLHLLQSTMQFTYSLLQANDIFIKNEPLALTHDGIKLDLPFTCKIALSDSIALSILLGNTEGNEEIQHRFYQSAPSEIDVRLKTGVLDLTPNIQTLVKDTKNIAYFQLKGVVGIKAFEQLRAMGVPFYISLDTYTFLVSFFAIPIFYSSIMESELLKAKYWTSLFLDEEDSKTMDIRIKALHARKERRFDGGELITLLKDIKLRCDITEYLYNHFFI